MKKIYTSPTSETIPIQPILLLNDSILSSNNGIIFGGIDEEGTMNPASREFLELFDYP